MVTKPTEGNTALSEKAPNIITIAAKGKPQDVKLRVAAYARVSTMSEDQNNSFEAQIVYYTTLIASKENWILVDVYADKGVTGTSAEKRKDFQRLLSDCRKGLIDRILVKSISRFARNTKECLETIRELKTLGVSICFEKENIDTSKISGEMLTALFASFSQAESESISGNMRWSYQKRMEKGLFNTCYAPYGYRLEKGRLIIQEDEAEAVQYIFTAYLKGTPIRQIVEYLEKTHKKTKIEWNANAVAYILQNERYAGNALLQKKYTTKTLPRKKLRNRGERQMYFVSGSNIPIISQETFEQAQKLRQSRIKYKPSPNPRPFSKVMYCGICGGSLRIKTIQGKTYMVCRKHEQDRKLCPLPHISENEVCQAFLRLYDKLKYHGEILKQLIEGFQTIRRRRFLWSTEIIEVNKKISELTSQNQMLASMKQQGLIDSDIFIYQRNQLAEQIRAEKQKRESLLEIGSDDTVEKTQDILDILETGPEFLNSFDQELFNELIDCIIAENGEKLKFGLRNGMELTESIERVIR